MVNEYPIVPGRGLVTREATEQRTQYLKNLGFSIDSIADTSLNPEIIRNNIESFVGGIEIPLGLVGPLLFNNNGKEELLYTVAGTLEGALIASMNRGAKAISKSGGFNASVLYQKMIRSPLFVFNNLQESVIFKDWIEKKFDRIKDIVEQYSNHAKLQTILPFVTGKSVHLKFVYTTSDASGQNMTTTCTWHGILWINRCFTEECNIEPVHFVIEGNGASDKKVSNFSMLHGRGVHVIAECELREEFIEKVLRTNSADFIRCINQSRVMSQLDGMIGFNINVANAIAAIFVATGQDLASIHESSTGILNIEKSDAGLYCSINLPSLVIGTVGGGTQLPTQNEALKIMKCNGTGKVERFAKLIAGFALSLEISTFAAVVGGQFAKAHEKLGRNKPVNWLTKSDVNENLIQRCLNGNFKNKQLVSVILNEANLVENGIIITLTNKINKKLVGFIAMEIKFKNDNDDKITLKQLLLKSKPLDTEVISGLHLMAASIDPQLADYIFEYNQMLEYNLCHVKEIILYDLLRNNSQKCMPEFYGHMVDKKREIYLLLFEKLDYSKLTLLNTENHPEKWTDINVRSTIKTINDVHCLFAANSKFEIPSQITMFEPWNSIPLYERLAAIIVKEYEGFPWSCLTSKLFDFILELKTTNENIQINKTVIHNDFNPRNICIRTNGNVCIYDWELSVINFPHRDIVEFLSFVLVDSFEEQELENHIKYHYAIQKTNVEWNEWKKAYIYSLKEYLVTRVSFYMVGRVLMDYEFAVRIFLNSFRMIDIIEKL